MKFLHNNPVLKDHRRKLRHRQTDAEKTFWSHVRNKQFRGMRFLRQYSVGSYILDFYCPDLRMAVELDGGQHNETDGKVYDAVRSEFLLAQDIDVLRFWNNEVLQNMQGVLDKMEEIVEGKRNINITPPDLPLP
jgi:very-short-patch-repair endonuclease